MGTSLLLMIYLKYETAIITTIIGILGGFLTSKTLTEKQQETITQQTLHTQQTENIDEITPEPENEI